MHALFLTLLVAFAPTAPAEGPRAMAAGLDGPSVFASDPCGCSRELRACLVAAGLSLGRCLVGSSTPARRALCYLSFELDLVLCAQRSGICELTCVP